MSKDIVSHGIFASYSEAAAEITSRIAGNEHLEKLFKELQECPLGKFLIQNRGLDAYWTKIITQNKGNYSCAFENKLITKPSVFNATQERYQIFKQKISKLAERSKILSVPAGLLPEFTEELILSKNFDIDAYDLDTSCAEKSELSKLSNVKYIVEDVFNLRTKGHYDVVVSNGLNIYLKTNDEVQRFFQILNDSLKQGGVLISSFIASLDGVNVRNPEDAKFGKEIFADILNVTWTKTHDEVEFRQLLSGCGFDIREIIYDLQRMFPTVIAIKK